MDGSRFDRMTRALVAGASRRQVLGAAAVGGVTALSRRGAVQAKCVAEGQRKRHHKRCCPGLVANAQKVCLTPTCTSNGDCEDGNKCIEDTCLKGQCVHVPKICDDGNACTTNSCDPASGCFFPTVSCDDGNACTTDSCNPAAGCVHTPIPNCVP